jgi:hypothetical protein
VTEGQPGAGQHQLTSNEKAWIEFIRIISCACDPKPTPTHIRALRDRLDAGRTVRD